MPGAFTSGTNHFQHAAVPNDADVAAEYEAGPYAGYGERIQKAFNELVPPEADPAAVVNAPFGQRPFRVHVDPSEDGGQVGFTVVDRLKTEMMYRTGLSELLKVAR